MLLRATAPPYNILAFGHPVLHVVGHRLVTLYRANISRLAMAFKKNQCASVLA